MTGRAVHGVLLIQPFRFLLAHLDLASQLVPYLRPELDPAEQARRYLELRGERPLEPPGGFPIRHVGGHKLLKKRSRLTLRTTVMLDMH